MKVRCVGTTAEFDSNPIRGRFNSWLLQKFEDDFDEEMGDRKQQGMRAFSGTVAEIGAGNGINFKYYPPDLDLVVYEPNPYMHKRLHAAAQNHNVDFELRAQSAEQLHFEDGTVDAVVSTLVLCTVPNPAQVIAEVHRVLRPGGQFFFIEHVAATEGRMLRRVQNLLFRPWHWLFEGCHTNRETRRLLEATPFSDVEIEHFESEKMPPVIVPMICGVAVK